MASDSSKLWSLPLPGSCTEEVILAHLAAEPPAPGVVFSVCFTVEEPQR